MLAIANSAGYRYGVSDLAFYLPAAFRSIDPSLFPRDAALLGVQSTLTLADEALAAALRVGRAVGVRDPAVVYAAHIGSLLLLFVAAVALGRACFRSPWAGAAFVAALTLRHAVARTGVNTLEGYFHPRVLAFAIGVLALAAFLRRGVWPALVLGLLAAAVHTTTGLWFLICVGVAGLVSERRDRLALVLLGSAAVLAFAWLVSWGPLSGRVHAMDPAWLSVISDKDYLFPDRWPAYAWATCAVYLVAIAAGAWSRWRDDQLAPRERGLIAGAAGLLIVFSLAVPLLVARSALVVQLQPSRVFWIFDLFATVAVVWIVEGAARPMVRRTAVFAVALILASASRGVYLMTIRFPERRLAALATSDPDWLDAMRWAQTTDHSSHWLAHPDHAFLYGSSLRVSGQRDVFVEAAKDPAVAMYDRAVAMRVAERLPLVAQFDGLTVEACRDLARRFDLDYIVTESALALPLAYESGRLRVYRLSGRGAS